MTPNEKVQNCIATIKRVIAIKEHNEGKRKGKLKQEEINSIISMRKRMSATRIALELDIAECTVRKYLRANNYE